MASICVCNGEGLLGLLEVKLCAVVVLAKGADLLVRRLDLVLEGLGLGLLVGDGVSRGGRSQRTERRGDEPDDERDETDVAEVTEQGQ